MNEGTWRTLCYLFTAIEGCSYGNSGVCYLKTNQRPAPKQHSLEGQYAKFHADQSNHFRDMAVI